jgi:DNA repair photolyase
VKNRLVVIPNTKKVIQPSGWEKKGLAEHHIELSGLCGFGCRYCSSNATPWMRINRERFGAMTLEQLGESLNPKDNPELAYVWSADVLTALRAELRGKPKSFGRGKTLALSQSTDPLSPVVDPKITEGVIRLLIAATSFRVRLLTKNAIIGSEQWIELLKEMGNRVVVSLSIGTLDHSWSSNIEVGTSTPVARLRALRRLQDAGVPTYGMLCPIFPSLVASGRLDDLVDAIRPNLCEFVWAEPYNDRDNWRVVRDGHPEQSAERDWFDRAFGPQKEQGLWSTYATDLYKTLRLRAEAEGWLGKLRYMLYEADVEAEHARSFCDLRGVLLQSIDRAGRSKHPEFRKLQDQAELTALDQILNPYEDRVADPNPAFLHDLHVCSVVGAASGEGTSRATCV